MQRLPHHQSAAAMNRAQKPHNAIRQSNLRGNRIGEPEMMPGERIDQVLLREVVGNQAGPEAVAATGEAGVGGGEGDWAAAVKR